MTSNFTLDDYEDAKELVDELDKWIDEKEERWSMGQIAAALLTTGACISFGHLKDLESSMRLIRTCVETAYKCAERDENS